ncbi:MAG: primosomal protein N' [Bacteroidaceae bacterium]|nr:primosomal protein N' [Bacteroidaceae bacterium]
MYADIVLPVPLPGLFTYSVPAHLIEQVKAGYRVIVPFGTKKLTTGLVARLHNTPPADTSIIIKDIEATVDTRPIILPYQLSSWQWIADYYLCSIGEVYKAALPALLKTDKSVKGRKTYKESSDFIDFTNNLPALSPAQQMAYDTIHEQWKQHSTCLLHGVTSSGKTEIYIHLITEALSQGKQVLYLLPEIVLTSQLTDRLRAVFGERLGVYHSKYSDRQRADVWQRQLSEKPYDIIVGVRSSVFIPFQRLGLVIVDEEHETNFKQQDPAPRYNARSVALMLASHFNAKSLLGSATPSLESYFNARRGKYGLVTLKERFGQVSLPHIEVVDTKEAQRKRQMSGLFSPRLLEVMREALNKGEQVILFQNRRGFAPQIECNICGWTPRCPHCDVSLTLHKRSQRMTCHYCGFTTEIPERCPACENDQLRQRGFGTERVEDDICREFPTAHIARMDMDTTRTRTAYEAIISEFAAGHTDILVGTQMVTKGLDFGKVSIVGILNADTMLNQPDYRAYEHAFQMMSQVAGRAGRRENQGTVILQARNADSPIISQVINNDYEAMYKTQMQERRQFAYPPFVRIITVYVKHRNPKTIEDLARELTIRLRSIFGTRVLGPDEPPVGRIQSLYIRRVLLKLEPSIPLQQARTSLLATRAELISQHSYSTAHIYFDVDPV